MESSNPKLQELRLDSGNKFQRFLLSPEEQTLALKLVHPLFIAYLTNKVADYAATLVETVPEYHADPRQQVQAILATEKLRNFSAAYEELLAEILDASSQLESPDSPT
jgi:hypothetical protein